MLEPRHPPTSPLPPVPQTGTLDGRCHFCGYTLYRVAESGNCPECGTPYTAHSASRLQPWPNAIQICMLLGWPVIGIFAVIAGTFWLTALPGTDVMIVVWIIVGCLFLLATPANTWYQVRKLLKRSLPEQKRTRGPVAIFRALGTVVCVLAFLFLLLPMVLLGACLIALATGNMNFH